MKRLLLLALLALAPVAQAEVYLTADNGTTSYFTPCFPLWNTTGESPVTGITNATSGFEVLLIADNESAATEFAGAADLETIATIGTWVTPTANTDIRFGECDATDLEGFYQVQFHNDHLAKSNATFLTVRLHDGATLFADQVLFIRQNPLTGADVEAEATDALEATQMLATGACDSGSTTTCVDADRTEADANYWVGAYFCSTSGTTAGQCGRINVFTPGSDTITWPTAFTQAISTNSYQIRSGLPDNSLTAAVLASDSIGASEIATDAIGAAEMAAGAIGTSELDATAVDEIWDEVAEDQGATYSARELLSLLLAEAMGTCVYTSGTRTWVCSDPSGTETRFTLVYGAELDGDRDTSTPAPMTP